jgi:hypothetical protein
VAVLPAVRAGEIPPGGLGDPSAASGAGRGRAPLIDQEHADRGGLGLIRQGADQVSDPPVPGPLVVPPACLEGQHAAGVPDRQGADPVLHRPGDDLVGGFVLGLADPPGMPGFGFPLAAPVLAPAPRPALPGLRGAGGGSAGAALAVAQVLPAFGPDRPPGHQQPLPFRARGCVRVDDAQVDPGGPGRVWPFSRGVLRDVDLGGHVRIQPPCVISKCHRPDLSSQIRDVSVQADLQRGAAARHRNPQLPPVQRERVP